MSLTNEQFEKIKRVYEQRRLENDYALRRRKDEIAEKIPGIKNLDEEMISLSMKNARVMVSEEDPARRAEALDELRKKIDAISGKKRALLSEHGYTEDYLDPSFHCSACRDTGFVNGEKCSCFKKLEVESLYDASQLEHILEENNFSRMSTRFYKGEELRAFEEAVRQCRSFIEAFPSGRNLMLFGPVGIGKSFLSGCVAKELLDRGFSILYFSAQQLFLSVSSVYYGKEKDELNSLYERLFSSDLLIIDDLGTEQVNEFTRSQLFTVLNERARRHRSVLTSTNFNLEELRQTYTDRLFSRLADNCDILHLTGKDIRLQKKIEASYGS
ncbi:MAG: ATP-binding protein [Lachnospiraceae bacterium]|nr:ATP-binding protein [Lachnospiraceae bacterium]